MKKDDVERNVEIRPKKVMISNRNTVLYAVYIIILTITIIISYTIMTFEDDISTENASQYIIENETIE